METDFVRCVAHLRGAMEDDENLTELETQKKKTNKQKRANRHYRKAVTFIIVVIITVGAAPKCKF